jgi:hypothetical protein
MGKAINGVFMLLRYLDQLWAGHIVALIACLDFSLQLSPSTVHACSEQQTGD